MERHPLVVAKEIQTRILKETGLSCSIGIAPTLFLAKMASDMKKPLGITVLRKRDAKKILYPLPVSDIYGIGKKTYPILMRNGIQTIEELMDEKNKNKVIELIGLRSYEYAYQHILGNSSNQVIPNRHGDSESISTSQTFDRIINSDTEVLYELRKMTREMVNKLNQENYYTKTINITLRSTEFKTMTRSRSLEEYVNDFPAIFEVVTDLVEEHYHGEELRLLGVGLSNLKHKEHLPKEYNLFTMENYEEKTLKIAEMIEEYQKKYGEKALFQNKNKNL